MSTLYIPVILGSGREGRQSETVAKFIIRELGKTDSVETDLVDVKDHLVSPFTTPSWGSGGADEVPTKWKEIAMLADGFIFVLPEYNHSFPGEFKLMLDSLSKKEYGKKPASVCGVSAGIFGGARLIDHIKPVLVELDMIPTKGAFYAGGVKDGYDKEGTSSDEAQVERLKSMINDLLWHTKTLKAGRES